VWHIKTTCSKKELGLQLKGQGQKFVYNFVIDGFPNTQLILRQHNHVVNKSDFRRPKVMVILKVKVILER
jgi:hypothetical protein